MIILGIETSCDDTSIAIVENGSKIIINLVSSQNDLHQEYGGIVPELASRKHLENLLPLIDQAFKEAGMSQEAIDAIAVTTHPGLIGSLLAGVNLAKTLAYSLEIPLIPVSHLKAHFYSLTMSTSISYPFVGLLVSGGHTLLALCHSPLVIEVIGSTLDDAVGECFDKVAKHFKLGYPGGPAIEQLALNGNENFFNYPIITMDRLKNRYHFSFSGLKTAVIHQSEKYATQPLKKKSDSSIDWEQIELADLAASFQKAALETLVQKTVQATQDYEINRVGICGGVAANRSLRKKFQNQTSLESHFPDFKLSTDNAGMIAGLAFVIYQADPKKYQANRISSVRAEAKSFKDRQVL